MSIVPPTKKRSRTGCWTCRQRKKKCDGTEFPCKNCTRLQLKCEQKVRLVWEDDERRVGIRRRGPGKEPPPPALQKDDALLSLTIQGSSQNAAVGNIPRNFSAWPFQLSATESLLLDRYIQRFSRTYPAFSGPTNPFLSVLIPLSTQSRVVLDSLLALSAVQSWENECFAMETAMLRVRERALRGCTSLLSGYATGQGDILHLLASCVLLLLYEKLAGEGHDNWTPHLQFFACWLQERLTPDLLESYWTPSTDVARKQALKFLSSLFFYNDLVRATSTHAPTLSNFCTADDSTSNLGYLVAEEGVALDRLHFPRLIARISSGDLTVTDADIASWNGRLQWVPSFSLCPEESLPEEQQPDARDQHQTIAQMYRYAAMIYRRQGLRRLHQDVALVDGIDSIDDPSSECLALWATEMLQLLPEGSAYETSLLWPIGIVSRELGQGNLAARTAIDQKLRSLEERYQMRHFGLIRKYLSTYWELHDQGYSYERSDCILFG